MKKYLLLAFVVTLLASGSYIAEKSFLASPAPTPTVGKTATNESAEVRPREIEVKPQPSARTPQIQTSITTNTPEAVPSPAPNVTLSVSGKSYATFAQIDSTVLDAMRTLASTSDFTFTGHDYPSLGFFVDTINGKKAELGYTWILYVNEKLSGTGASQTTLNAGDIVEWKYEKSY